MLGRAIPTRAGRQRAEQVNLGEELQKVARTYRARLHEVLVRVVGEASTHENVEHVMHIGFDRLRRPAGLRGEAAAQVGVAAVVVLPATEQVRGIGVAVMTSTSQFLPF